MSPTRKAEQLKDRRDYRASLIQRREDLERKIEKVEKEISALTEAKQ